MKPGRLCLRCRVGRTNAEKYGVEYCDKCFKIKYGFDRHGARCRFLCSSDKRRKTFEWMK